ncbi:MAG: hypothetical protein FD139_3786 [Methylocystaceae bacterium]|nr:MAG: hypothetical protein FD139_3786 [Methylocystaceae bacterium]
MQDEIFHAWVWSEYKGELPQSADERRLAEWTALTVFAGAGQRAIYVAVGLATGMLVSTETAVVVAPPSSVTMPRLRCRR